jgi:hypothetical protein
VLTDPLVRSVQIGPPPLGQVTAINPATGIGVVSIPGIGVRRARLLGMPVSWAGRQLVRAVDLDTGVEFPAVLPEQPQLTPATMLRANGDTLLVRRTVGRATVTEAVPVAAVLAMTHGSLAPAVRVPGALRRGAQVWLIPQPATVARVIRHK